jgi:ActR/RegA family two-component response regulator
MSQQKSDYDDVRIDDELDALPSDDELDETVANLEANGFAVTVVDTREEALEAVESLIPDGASVDGRSLDDARRGRVRGTPDGG